MSGSAAIKRGAYDFIEKPFEAERLILLVARATETDRLRRENATLKERSPDDELNGNSPAINTVRATLKRVAGTGSRVLITGPAGVGKEIAARMLHNWSARIAAPFVVVSAARIEESESEAEVIEEAPVQLAPDDGAVAQGENELDKDAG